MAKRPLHSDERALWQRLIATVEPLAPANNASHPVAEKNVERDNPKPVPKHGLVKLSGPKKSGARLAASTNGSSAKNTKPVPIAPGHLDGRWDRRLNKGVVSPDVTVDLHGHSLSAAYAHLDSALEMSVISGLRTILLITGKARADYERPGTGRGAIRAAVTDWLAVSRHSSHISAVRNAHPRHGGSGALYIILRRAR